MHPCCCWLAMSALIVRRVPLLRLSRILSVFNLHDQQVVVEEVRIWMSAGGTSGPAS